jgi:hypothetical protein
MGGVPERLGSNPGRRLNEPIAEELPLPEMAHMALQEISPRLANHFQLAFICQLPQVACCSTDFGFVK